MNVDAVFRMPFGSRLCIAAGPAAVCFPEPDRLLPTAVVCRAFTAPRPRTFVRLFFYSVGTSVLPYFALWETRPLFNSGPDSVAGPAVCIPHTAVCPVVFSFGSEAIACLIVCSSAVRLQLPVR